jgi:hypothetical protein
MTKTNRRAAVSQPQVPSACAPSIGRIYVRIANPEQLRLLNRASENGGDEALRLAASPGLNKQKISKTGAQFDCGTDVPVRQLKIVP